MNSQERSKLSLRKTLIFTAVTMVIAVLAGEIGLRVAGYSPSETCYVNAPGIHHIHKSNYVGEHAGQPMETNTFRLCDDVTKKGAGVETERYWKILFG